VYEFIHLGLEYDDLDEFQKNKANWLEESRYSENTKKTYWQLIDGKVHRFETVNGKKDLYDFNRQEIIQLVKKSSNNTSQQIKSNNLKVIQRKLNILETLEWEK
jgi:hypothetical protein